MIKLIKQIDLKIFQKFCLRLFLAKCFRVYRQTLTTHYFQYTIISYMLLFLVKNSRIFTQILTTHYFHSSIIFKMLLFSYIVNFCMLLFFMRCYFSYYYFQLLFLAKKGSWYICRSLNVIIFRTILFPMIQYF